MSAYRVRQSGDPIMLKSTAARASARPISSLVSTRTATVTGTFTRYPALVHALPPLIKQQRRLAARIASVADAVIDEKAVRADIDVLLIAAGLTKSEVVTCAGYDVRHHEKAGSTSINRDTLTELLVAAGVDRGFVEQVLVNSTDTGHPSVYATVTPSKGATVRPPEPLRMAKATTRPRA